MTSVEGGAWGSYVRIHIDNWDVVARCGYKVPLPTILPPEGDYKNYGSSNSRSGSDWSKAKNPEFEEIHGGWLDQRVLSDAPKDYRYLRLDYRRG